MVSLPCITQCNNNAEKVKNIATIDLFAGAGGLSLGFKKAGFTIIQAVEIDAHAANTYRHNHPQTNVIEKDIQNVDPIDCLKQSNLRPGDVGVLIGGPPCQGFSESNRRTRTLSNPKNLLYQEFLRFLKVIQPRWFVIENVAGLRTLAKGTILQCIIKECSNEGYLVDWKELNAADHGVPQFRRRLFIVGNRLGLPISFPSPTHGPNMKPYVTVREAISDLPSLANGATVDRLPYGGDNCSESDYKRTMRSANSNMQGNLVTNNSNKIIERYKYIKQGQNWTVIPHSLMADYSDFTRCHTGIYHRLEWEKPAKVIGNFRKNMLIHPEQHRGLSVREAARLQSFPDNYEFIGSIGFQQQQVADSVPPLLAESIARCILNTDQSMNADDIKDQKLFNCK
ncbi:MAG: DNA cytosine methyltransferase [Armatimonadota bacterium]